MGSKWIQYFFTNCRCLLSSQSGRLWLLHTICQSVPLLRLLSRLLWVGFWWFIVQMLELRPDWLYYSFTIIRLVHGVIMMSFLIFFTHLQRNRILRQREIKIMLYLDCDTINGDLWYPFAMWKAASLETREAFLSQGVFPHLSSAQHFTWTASQSTPEKNWPTFQIWLTPIIPGSRKRQKYLPDAIYIDR